MKNIMLLKCKVKGFVGFLSGFGFLFLMVITSCNAQGQLISGSGVGVGESRISACEIAIKVALHEATQTLISTVQATTEVYESDGGVAYRSANLVVSNSSLKMVEKQEKLSFSEESGLITCSVLAYFSPEVGSVYNEKKDRVSSEELNIGKQGLSGRAFCSDEMNMCFREYYLEQTKSFGIQILSSYGNASWKLMFFDRIKVWSESEKSYVYKLVTTEYDLRLLIKRRLDSIGPSCYSCAVDLVVSGVEWDTSTGYKSSKREDLQLVGRYRRDIDKWQLGLSLSEDDVQRIDRVINEIN